MPEHGWYNIYLYELLIGGTLIVLLLTGLTRTLLNLDEHRKKFKKLAVTDSGREHEEVLSGKGCAWT